MMETTSLPDGIETRVAPQPSYAQAQFFFESENFSWTKYASNTRRPTIKGAKSKSGHTWAYWQHDYPNDVVAVLRIGTTLEDTTSTLALQERAHVLQAAQEEAAASNLSKVVIWSPDEVTVRACRTRCEKTGHAIPNVALRSDYVLPCLRPRGGFEVHGTEWSTRVEWVLNEKYSWC